MISSNGGLSAWDRTDPQRPRKVATLSGISAFPVPDNAPDITISDDGRPIAAGGQDIAG